MWRATPRVAGAQPAGRTTDNLRSQREVLDFTRDVNERYRPISTCRTLRPKSRPPRRSFTLENQITQYQRVTCSLPVNLARFATGATHPAGSAGPPSVPVGFRKISSVAAYRGEAITCGTARWRCRHDLFHNLDTQVGFQAPGSISRIGGPFHFRGKPRSADPDGGRR
jgi:hypothetical protein